MERPGGPFHGLSAAAQTALSLCANDYDSEPGPGECRIYRGLVSLGWQAWGKTKRNLKNVRFEIACRADRKKGTTCERKAAWIRGDCNKLLQGNPLPRVSADTPADYIEKLLKIEPRHTSRPCWDTFDFSAMVAVLSSWLGACSWAPSLYLHDLTDVTKIRLTVISNLEDSAALACNAVFISQMVSSRPASGAYWALTAAAAACGVVVATDRAIMSGADTPRFYSRSGIQLWQDILDALRILAELYDRASAGEVYAYAFFKGLHTVNTVVAHSDEGGLMRDVFRECHLPKPYGGLPPDSPYHSGMPTLAATSSYASLAQIVDSYCLRSAASLANCAPLMQIPAGGGRPMVVEGTLPEDAVRDLPEPPASDQAAHTAWERAMARIAVLRAKHVDSVRAPLLDAFGTLAETYVPALACLLGFAPSCERVTLCRAWVQCSLDSVLAEPNNRHLTKNSILCPFFWIEPTTVLPANCFGTAAEREGWGSYGCGLDIRQEPMLPAAEVVDQPRFGWQFYEMDFEGARKSPWLLALSGHHEDGVAQMHFKRLDPEQLMFCGGLAGREGPVAAFMQKRSVGDYQWIRGQSALPHPSEFSHLGSRVVVAVRHFDESRDRWISAMPSQNEIGSATVTYTFTNPTGVRSGQQCGEGIREGRYRTRGEQAFSAMCRRLINDVGLVAYDRGYVMCEVGKRPSGQGNQGVNLGAPHNGPPTPGKAQLTTQPGPASRIDTAAPPVQPVKKTAAAPTPPVLQVGAHTGPRLPGAGVPSGGADGQAAVGHDGQAGHGGIAQPVVVGAAGGGNNPDGRGAAGATPGC